MSKYIKEELEVMLRNHLKNEAKLTEILLKKEEYQELLNYAGTVYESTQEEAIKNMQLSGKGYDSVNSHTNKTSDTVGNTAINYHKEERHINKEDREYLEKKIEECDEEKKKLDKVIVRVKNLLEQLKEEERFVVVAYYMKRAKWDYVEKVYFNEFEIHKTIRQLQAYRDNALNNMLEVLNVGA